MHLVHPVTKAVQDHSAYHRVIRIQGVSRPGEVCVAGAVLAQQIVGGIIQAAEALRGTIVPSLRRVIENHVEYDFDAGPVQRFDHIPKFIQDGQGLPVRAVCLVGRKK